MKELVLDEPQRLGLVDAFKKTKDRRLRDRCQAVLLWGRGEPTAQIAKDLYVSERSVQRWLRAFRQGGVAGLYIPPGKGQPLKIPDALAPRIKQWVLDGPVACGRLRANWTYAELAAQLLQAEGLKASRRTVCNFCHKHGIKPYRPTYRFLRGDPQKQQVAQAELCTLKKRPKRSSACC